MAIRFALVWMMLIVLCMPIVMGIKVDANLIANEINNLQTEPSELELALKEYIKNGAMDIDGIIKDSGLAIMQIADLVGIKSHVEAGIEQEVSKNIEMMDKTTIEEYHEAYPSATAKGIFEAFTK